MSDNIDNKYSDKAAIEAIMTETKNRMLRQGSIVPPIIKNPFINKINLTVPDKLKIGLNAVILLPIRFIFFVILLSVAASIGFVITLGKTKEELNTKPLTGWRRKMRGVLRFLGRALAFVFGFHKIKKNGIRATRDEATIFVAAPHTSFFDAWVFFILGLPSGVSKAENADIPIIGHLVKAAQMILVGRDDKVKRSNTVEEIKKRADPKSEWPQVLIFPEGTTTNGCSLITFKPGILLLSFFCQFINYLLFKMI
jgi:lysophosphatidylcholine acyltransferase / lyso-PAF acetyltransferase